jgi:hypothetical protein
MKEDRTVPVIPESEARRVAVEAGSDERTVKKILTGKPVRPLTATRIISALKRLGYGDLIPKNGAAPAPRRVLP